ncbi:MAG TPA: T9SS type A sorting domain-containing protein [Bacteroidia bacterium]|nr:T9SS type A sorting domain-containing protein [Bacteroidia bacterium]
MKTSQIILAALLFSTGIILGQNSEHTKKVRIRKVENINGVEKVTDTTFYSNDLSDLPGHDKTIICIPGNPSAPNIDIRIEQNLPLEGRVESDQVLKAELERIQAELRANGADAEAKGHSSAQMQTIVIENEERPDASQLKTDPGKIKRIILIRNIQITEASKEEISNLNKSTGFQGKDLEVQDLKLSPNPSTGITGISLVLPTKGLTTIAVINTMGQAVYREELECLSEKLVHELDLNALPRGVYFIRVTQNGKAFTKKLLLN